MSRWDDEQEADLSVLEDVGDRNRLESISRFDTLINAIDKVNENLLLILEALE